MDKAKAATALKILMESELDSIAKSKLALFFAGSAAPEQVHEIAADIEDDDMDKALHEETKRVLEGVFMEAANRLNGISQERWDNAD